MKMEQIFICIFNSFFFFFYFSGQKSDLSVLCLNLFVSLVLIFLESIINGISIFSFFFPVFLSCFFIIYVIGYCELHTLPCAVGHNLLLSSNFILEPTIPLPLSSHALHLNLQKSLFCIQISLFTFHTRVRKCSVCLCIWFILFNIVSVRFLITTLFFLCFISISTCNLLYVIVKIHEKFYLLQIHN